MSGSRSYFFDGFRPDLPSLGYPPLEVCAQRVRIPDDWVVWGFADVHGVLSGLREALAESGLTDADGRWIGGSEVALVGLGDYLDRGRDSRGVVEFLQALGPEMAAAGSRLVLVRGNHEQMVADILRGSDEWFDSWLINGGHALARSYGLAGAHRPASGLADALNAKAPDLLPWLLETLPHAHWRDVVFVHAGLPSHSSLGVLLIDDRQLWDPDAAFASGAGVALEPALWAFRDYGIRRVVIGHYPQDLGPTIDHDGTLLLLDTNAPGMRSPSGIQMTSFVSLAKIPPEGSLQGTEFVMVDTSQAPDRAAL